MGNINYALTFQKDKLLFQKEAVQGYKVIIMASRSREIFVKATHIEISKTKTKHILAHTQRKNHTHKEKIEGYQYGKSFS